MPQQMPPAPNQNMQMMQQQQQQQNMMMAQTVAQKYTAATMRFIPAINPNNAHLKN